jgi:F-box domain
MTESMMGNITSRSRYSGKDRISCLPREILLSISSHLPHTSVVHLSQPCRSLLAILYNPRPPKRHHLEFPCPCHVTDTASWSHSIHDAIASSPTWKRTMEKYMFMCPHRTQQVQDMLHLHATPAKWGKRKPATFPLKLCEDLDCRQWISHSISRSMLSVSAMPDQWSVLTQITVVRIDIPQGPMGTEFDPSYLPAHPTIIAYLLAALQEMDHIPICPHVTLGDTEICEAAGLGKVMMMDATQIDVKTMGEVKVHGGELSKCTSCPTEHQGEVWYWWSAKTHKAGKRKLEHMHISLDIIRGLGKVKEPSPGELGYWTDPSQYRAGWQEDQGGRISASDALRLRG